jgi:hypothetical protein
MRWSSPGRSALRAQPFAARHSSGRRSASRRGRSSRRTRTHCSTSLTGSQSTRRTSRRAPAVASAIELERVPLAEGAQLDDVGFGEDYELLAAVAQPTRFARSAAVKRARASS